MEAVAGKLLVSLGATLILFLGLKLVAEPFFPDDHPIHRYLPATDYVLAFPVMCGVIFFSGIGEVTGILDGEMSVQNKTLGSEPIVWPVISGCFKVLVNLVSGDNLISFICNSSTKQISLNYKPLSFNKFVRLVYIVCQDDPGFFQAPPGENNSASSAVKRISLAMQMLQTFTAEKIKCHGLNPKTFALEEEEDRPVCHIFKSSLLLKNALDMSENELWEHFALELMSSSLRVSDNSKFLAIMSFTRYVNNTFQQPKSFKEAKGMVQGYAALAAGGLALLGSACLHTWPENLSEIPWRFGDTRRIDKINLMDDSCNRGWYWACYASSLGATLHELGHIFDLGHTPDGIMSRGFDNIHRFFIVDLFYCSRTYQRKHNPHYQKLHHEKQHAVQLQKKSQASWSVSTTNRNMELSKKQSCKTNGKSPSSGKPPWRVPQPSDVQSYSSLKTDAFWARSSALILYYHKWFNEEIDSEICDNILKNEFSFTSLYGIRVVEYRDDDGMAFHHLEFTSESGPEEVDVKSSLVSSKQLIPDTLNVKVHVQDTMGNICQCTYLKSSFMVDS